MDRDPEFNRPAFKRPPRRTHWFAWVLLIVVVCPALLVAATFPMAYWSARRAACRAWCGNNMEQIAIALHRYEETYGTLPPAWTVDSSGRRLQSWRTLILPFLDEEDLYRRIDLSKPWDDPANVAAARELPVAFGTADRGGMPDAYGCFWAKLAPGMTTYLAVVGPDACFLPGRGRSRAEIASDPVATLTMIEANAADAVPWMAPLDADAAWLGRVDLTTGYPHDGGRNAAFLDGHVEFLKPTTSPPVVREWASISRPREPNPAR